MTLMQQVLGVRQPNMASQSLMQWIAEQEQNLRAGYAHYDKYYRGEHEVLLTDRLKRFIDQRLQFRDNFCEVVVDVMAERLNVIGFESGNETLDEWVWDLWQANRMDLTQITVHTDTIKKGDSYVLVDWDVEANQPRFTFQDADMMIARYDPRTRKPAWISKKWVEVIEIGEEETTRLNIYYPERVEKYKAVGGVWQPHMDEDDAAWPLPWLTKDNQPLGVAPIHFRNKPGGDDFGISELENVIPMQDLLNKSLVDLMQIEDILAFPQRWTIGVEKPSEYVIVPGAVWDLQSEKPENAKVGQFEPANVDGILRAIETILQHIAGRSRTPQHLFHISGDFPSGEALKTAEAGLVNKVKIRQVGLGNAWEDCIKVAMRLQERFGSGMSFEKGLAPEAIWDDPESRNEAAFIASLEAKERLGVPKRQIFRELGYDAEQIEQFEQDIQDEKVADSNIGSELLRRFSQGGV